LPAPAEAEAEALPSPAPETGTPAAAYETTPEGPVSEANPEEV
jgi:hypothetical protein